MKNIEKFISDFIDYCRFEKNLSQKTLKSYSIDLRQFVVFLKCKGGINGIEMIDKNVIRAYLQSMPALKPKSVKRKIATIKAMFNYLEYEDRISVSPMRKMKIQIREPFRLPRFMNINEVERFIRSVYNFGRYDMINIEGSNRWKIRDIAVIELLFATGMRVSEISNLRIDSINIDTGLIRVKGKGNKERIITVCNQEVLGILNIHKSHFHKEGNEVNNYFFLNRLNNRLSEQSIRFTVKKYAQLAGLKCNITPHVFRHTFATLLLQQNVDIKYIQHLLGHSSIMTTQIYTHVDSERQKEILLQKHPRKLFKVFEESLVA